MAIMGEMKQIKGYKEINGKLSYMPQEAWLVSDTLRENVILGSPFDERKYYRAIYASDLIQVNE